MKYFVAEDFRFKASIDGMERRVRFVVSQKNNKVVALQLFWDGEWTGALPMFYGELEVDVLQKQNVRTLIERGFQVKIFRVKLASQS